MKKDGPVRPSTPTAELIGSYGEFTKYEDLTKKTTADGRTYQEGANPDELYLEWLVPYKQASGLSAMKQEEVIIKDQVETAGVRLRVFV